jgi:hypothetical protein
MPAHDIDGIATLEVRHARHPALGHRHSHSVIILLYLFHVI